MVFGRRITIGAVTLAIVAGSSAVASAEQAACSCSLPPQGGALVGKVEASVGRVVVLGPQGPRRASVGQPVTASDRVATSVQSQALVNMSTCQLALGGEQELRFEKQGENICARIVDTPGVAMTGQVDENSLPAPIASSSYVLPSIGIGLVAATAIIDAASDNGKPVSR